MHFNKAELASLVTNPATRFDKEGPLIITERQEGIFWRTDGEFRSVWWERGMGREISLQIRFMHTHTYSPAHKPTIVIGKISRVTIGSTIV